MTEQTHSHRLSSSVIDAVATDCGADPLELDPLYEVIDPDALDAMFRGRDAPGSVSFVYAGRQVTVTADGEVAVAAEQEPSPLSEV